MRGVADSERRADLARFLVDKADSELVHTLQDLACANDAEVLRAPVVVSHFARFVVQDQITSFRNSAKRFVHDLAINAQFQAFSVN